MLSLPRAYRVDGSGVHVTAGFATETLPWPAITAVTSARGQIVLWQGWRKATGIPSGGLTPAERDRLLEVLHSRGRSLTPA